jgi:hypothetical protein
VDALFGYAEAFPHCSRFLVTGNIVIACEDGDRQCVRIDSQPFCQKLIAIADGFFLEVVSEGPVSQHFEKGKMVGISDRIDIAGADTLLVVDQSVARWVFLAKNVGYQRMHPCGGEEDRGVVLGYQGGSRDLRMVFGNKEFYVLVAEFVCFHRVEYYARRGAMSREVEKRQLLGSRRYFHRRFLGLGVQSRMDEFGAFHHHHSRLQRESPRPEE